jgi:ATP/maltotriose-dependent transcriptional regulator MalT
LHVLKGDFAKGASLIEESSGISDTTGVRLPPYAPVLLAALRGREMEAHDLMAASTRDLLHRGEGAGLTYLEWARANLSNGLGRYEEALAAALRAADDRHEFRFSSWVAMELVEAAVRGGNTEHAMKALKRLSEDVRASGGGWALGVEARSRALLAEGEAAESLYREAIERLRRTPLRVPVARAYLLYGEWLRRENRRVDSRVQLRAAHDPFTSIGMEAFAERARKELLATGEKARRRTVETRDDLTAQERQIAQLARDGLSNPEIGARLFLSPRTVEWHLRKVFGKLGIHYRQELANALPGSGSELTPA